MAQKFRREDSYQVEENWDDNEVPATHALVIHQNREHRRRNRPKEKLA